MIGRRPLNRRMFTTPQQRRGMARMPQGILASGPRIMNAAMNQFGTDNSIVTMPDIGGPIRQDGIVTIPEMIPPGPQDALPNSQGTPQGSPPVIGGEDNIGTLDDVAPDNQPAPIPSPPKPKPSKQEVQKIIEARDEANKPSSEQTMESIMDKIAKLRGTADEKKTKKQALEEAKQFLKDAGVPDIVGCHRGNFFAFECKSGKNKPTALQEKNLSDISGAGGIARVINEDNMMDIENILKGIDTQSEQIEMDFPVQYE